MKISTTRTDSSFEVAILSFEKPGSVLMKVSGASLKQVEKFKYLELGFAGDGT